MLSEHEWSEELDQAIARFEAHLRRADDDTLVLEAADGPSIGINDPVMFADLKRSLDVTNTMIRRGEIKSEQVTKYTP